MAATINPASSNESWTKRNPKEREPPRQHLLRRAFRPSQSAVMLRSPKGNRRSLGVETHLRKAGMNNSFQAGGFCRRHGRWGTFWRTSRSVKARKVSRVKPWNAILTPPGRMAWRIRIGIEQSGGNARKLSRCGFLIYVSFSNRCLVGKKGCLSLPPD